MKSFEEVREVYLLLRKKGREQGLSKEEGIARHTLSWVLGYSITNPFDFAKYVMEGKSIEKRLQKIKRHHC